MINDLLGPGYEGVQGLTKRGGGGIVKGFQMISDLLRLNEGGPTNLDQFVVQWLGFGVSLSGGLFNLVLEASCASAAISEYRGGARNAVSQHPLGTFQLAA